MLLISKIYQEFLQLKKKLNTLILKMGKEQLE